MKKWQLLAKKRKGVQKPEEIVKILLANRGLTTKTQKEAFLTPTRPEEISLKDLGLSEESLGKIVQRLKEAKRKKEKIVIYGDYDADGVCATAILWETLFALGIDCLPYIPDRFSEGYGLNAEVVKALKEKEANLKLVITVDNGIVAGKAVGLINQLGIDVVVCDHHQKGKRLPGALAIFHTTATSGSGVAWFLAREIKKKLGKGESFKESLDLACIGTVSDQLPLLGVNRSLTKYGLEALNKTKRVGLKLLLREAGVGGEIGTYEINFMIAPRLNAMGRMEHAIDSLRLLCTPNSQKASLLASALSKANIQRQETLEGVVLHARQIVQKKAKGVIIVSHESYHEGVVGLAASRLVEEFWRPAIVVSKGKEVSKASARSIPGFNIIEAIREFEDLLEDAGGHPMAAGFSIRTENLAKFTKNLNQASKKALTEDLLERKLKIDLEIDFEEISWELMKLLEKFQPTGIGNATPTFLTKKVEVVDSRLVGKDGKHLKLTLKKRDTPFGAIAFWFGERQGGVQGKKTSDIVYNLEENTWNDKKAIQLKVKDIH